MRTIAAFVLVMLSLSSPEALAVGEPHEAQVNTPAQKAIAFDRAAEPSKWQPTPPAPARWPYLILVAGGVLLGVLVLRLRERNGPSFDGTPSIEVVATRALTSKTRVMLIETKGREMLLSVTDRGAELLTEWLDEDVGEALAPAAFTRPLKDPPALEILNDDDGDHEFAEDEDEDHEDDPTSPEVVPELADNAVAVTEGEAIKGLLELRKTASRAIRGTPPWTRLQKGQP